VTDPEEPPGPFLESLRRAHEMRLWRLESAPQPVIDKEFEEIAEDFQVLPDPGPCLLRRIWLAAKTDLLNIIMFLTP
jgi:hypothetical protein